MTHQTPSRPACQTVGWLVIGSSLLIILGISSAAELDSRAILGSHFPRRHASKVRTTATVQLAFSFSTFLIAIPLPITMTQVDALAVCAFIASIVASLLGIVSAVLTFRNVSWSKWPHHFHLPTFDRSWGTSVACHCCCLLAVGLHVYFSTQIVSDCRRDSVPEEDFRPNCDSNVGVLAGIIPHILNCITLIVLGLTSVYHSIRASVLEEDVLEVHASDIAAINFAGDIEEQVCDISVCIIHACVTSAAGTRPHTPLRTDSNRNRRAARPDPLWRRKPRDAL